MDRDLMRRENSEIWINRNLSVILTFRFVENDIYSHKLVVVILFPTIRSIGSLFVPNNILGFHFGGSLFFDPK